MVTPTSTKLHDSPADWTLLTTHVPEVRRMEFTGRYRAARRCIDPPRLELTGIDGADRYEVLISPHAAPNVIHRAGSPTPVVDLAPIWSDLPFGLHQLTGRAIDAGGQVIGVTNLKSLVKAADWDGRREAPLNYLGAGTKVIDYLCHQLPPAPAHPDDPAYFWHAAAQATGTQMHTELQFPALCYPMLINLFLTGDRLGLGDGLVDRSRRLADFLLDHPMVKDGPLAGIPMSTMGQDGRGGLFEADRTTLVRLGWTGATMLDLAGVTADARYARYAERLGEILIRTQQPDGAWPYRLRIADGAVVESYTAAGVMALFLLERLAASAGGARYQAAFDRGLEWVLAHPVQTGLWQQMYEDVRTLEPWENLEQWAALETAILLLRRRHPAALPVARRLVRYVEDQFVLFGDEASLPVPYLPWTPAVMEQYHCYWPMDVHTANYACAALALHQATGDATGEAEWAAKAIAAANTVVRCQRPDGRLSTLVPDRRFGTTPPFSDWFNCMAHAANVLLTIGPRLTQLGREGVHAA